MVKLQRGLAIQLVEIGHENKIGFGQVIELAVFNLFIRLAGEHA